MVHRFTAISLASAFAATAQGAVVLTASGTAPATGGSDQYITNDLAAIPGGSFNSQAFSDNAGPPGQSFTTGAGAGYQFTAFSFKGAAASGANYGGFDGSSTWSIRISTVSGTTLTPVATINGIAHPTGVTGNEWFTWAFSGGDLLTLAGSTTYAFEAYSSNGYLGFDASDGLDYVGGTAFNSTGGSRAFGSNTLQDRLYDRTFVANLTPVPEPSASLLLGGTGLLALRRRRR